LFLPIHSERDEKFNAERIAFGYNQKSFRRFAVVDQTCPDIACNHNPTPPALVAKARAGNQLDFMWNPWFVSHKGPLITYMAAYVGPVDKVDLNSLKFFKIAERGLARDNITWAVDEMMDMETLHRPLFLMISSQEGTM
jgi:lytic cellulose monooxygenase (C1-hydroxylating)